jgi:tetratricopeptide (TPR) repeat protein
VKQGSRYKNHHRNAKIFKIQGIIKESVCTAICSVSVTFSFPFMMNRLEQLLEFYKEDPEDPFNTYALALEFLKIDSPKGLRLLEELVKDHENYVPTYYVLAKLYQEQGHHEQSVKVFEKGISKAREQNDTKALRELQAAYQQTLNDEY